MSDADHAPGGGQAGGKPSGQLFADLPLTAAGEVFQTLFANAGCRIERIVSCGHATPPGAWYDQDDDEWVVLLRGEATLSFDDGHTLALRAGDWVTLPAHRRHRVERVSADAIWLAVHCRAGGEATG